MPKTNPKMSTKKIEIEHNYGQAKVLELGAYGHPQAHLLWEPPSTIEYVDLPDNRDFYEGTLKYSKGDPLAGVYAGGKEFYKDKKVHYGNASRLDEFIEEKYDVIFASHILEHFAWWDIHLVLQSWVNCLDHGGALHVIVPSLEWCAEEILKGSPSKGLLPLLHGGQTGPGDVHLCMFTMRYLRARLEAVGLTVMQAMSGQRNIQAGEEEVPTDQHYVVALYLTDEDELPPLMKE
jgi:hypothetical protein